MKSPETPLLTLALVDLVASLVVGWFRPARGRLVLIAGIAMLAAALAVRGFRIGYIPLTQRAESIAGFVLCVAFVTLFSDTRWFPLFRDADGPEQAPLIGSVPWEWRVYRTLLLCPAIALLGWSARCWPEARHPVPLLVTIWYVIHVPLSFLAYGIWTAAFAAAVVRLGPGREDGSPVVMIWDERIRSLVFWGFILFSISMIMGGIWGYLAWGFVFLWDPKVTLSVALWLAYAAIAHLTVRGTRPRLRAWLAIPGWLLMLAAFLGVSFFRSSIHGF
jgi:ABC-type transport system involved in cytochrome c biogenesis permease subunit